MEPTGQGWPGPGAISSGALARPRSAPWPWSVRSSSAPPSGWPHHRRHRRRRGRAEPGDPGDRGNRRVVGLGAQPGELGQHVVPGCHRAQHQRGLPRGRPHLTGRPGGVCPGRGVRGADQGHQPLRRSRSTTTEGSTAGRSTPSSPPSTRPTRPRCGPCARRGPRALQPVFAVLDGLGDWTGDDQLCITQEGHTPFIGQWTTVTNWTNQGSPYLWWTGPDQAAILQAVVNWGLSADLIGGDDQGRGHRRRPGVRPGGPQQTTCCPTSAEPGSPRWSRPSTPTRTTRPPPTPRHRWSSSSSASAGVTSVIPLMPFNVFYPVLQAETAQQWYPEAPPERLRGEHRVGPRAAARPLCRGPQRTGGTDHRDPRRHRRRPTAEPGRLRPRRAQVLDRLAQGVSRRSPRAT